jgi:hypothetical protein
VARVAPSFLTIYCCACAQVIYERIRVKRRCVAIPRVGAGDRGECEDCANDTPGAIGIGTFHVARDSSAFVILHSTCGLAGPLWSPRRVVRQPPNHPAT